MFRFSFFGLTCALSLILIGGFVAMNAPHFNQPKKQAQDVVDYLTQLIHLTRTQSVSSQSFPSSTFSFAGIAITRTGSAYGFQFYLANITDTTCVALVRRFAATAQVKVFEKESTISSTECIAQKNNKKRGALALSFVR